MNIAIAISTHNRYEVFKETFKNVKKYAPKGAKIIVVDDGSTKRVKEATFRFEIAKGIAITKNKCLELCGDADYVFLFDDDVYPKTPDWHLPYINSGMQHLCFTFGRFSNGVPNGRIKLTDNGRISSWKEPCGLMLFFTKRCLQEVGGFDPAYGVWGYEHVGLSRRIFNAGLIPKPFMDVSNSLDLFYSYDWDQTTGRSVAPHIRNQHIRPNQKKYAAEIDSKRFIPYKPMNTEIVTCYFTGVEDPQRGEFLTADLSVLVPLCGSCYALDLPLSVLHDCFDITNRYTRFIRVAELPMNPYFRRWSAILNYLQDNPHIDQLFCVDATDVEVQINPFPHIEKGFLYVGDEPSRVNNQWLIKHHTHRVFETLYVKFDKFPLLNAGIVGGYRDDVIRFCSLMMDMYRKYGNALGLTDMATMNYICYVVLGLTKVRRGPRINTEFKSFKSNNTSWFKHK